MGFFSSLLNRNKYILGESSDYLCLDKISTISTGTHTINNNNSNDNSNNNSNNIQIPQPLAGINKMQWDTSVCNYIFCIISHKLSSQT